MDGWIVFSRLSSDTTSSVKSTRHSRDSSLCSVTLSSEGFPGGLAAEESTCDQETPVQFLGQEDPPEER